MKHAMVGPVAQAAVSEAEARFDRTRRAVGLVLAPLSLVVLLLVPMPGLNEQAHTLAAIATMTVIFWITETIPLAVSALLGLALSVLLGVADADVTFAPLGDPLTFLFLGGFLLAGALQEQGFDRRVALWLVSRRFVGGSPARALYAIGAVGFTFSMWISNTATTTMLIPVVVGLHQTMCRFAPDDPDTRRALDRFGGAMCLALAYCSSMGGSATPIGTAPNVIAVGMLDDQTGVRLDFGTWMAFGLPIAMVMSIFIVFMLVRAFPPPFERVEGLTEEVTRRLAELGPMRSGERRVLWVFGLTVVGWLLPAALRIALGPEHPWSAWSSVALNDGAVAMAGGCLLFLVPSGEPGPPGERPRLITWETAQRIDWGTLLLLGGGLALGKLTFTTGLSEAIGRGVLSVTGPVAAHPAGLLVIATVLVIFMTELTSNTATTSMMLPVIIGIAQASGFPPVATAITVTLAASHAYMLPVSTPPNAMAYGTRLIRLDDMVRLGLRLDLVGALLLCAVGIGVLQAVFG